MSDPPSLAARATDGFESAVARSAKAEATSGNVVASVAVVPAFRYAHAGYRLRFLRFQRFQLRGRADAQERKVAADREEAEAALRRKHGAIGIDAIEPRDLVRLGGGGKHTVELALDEGRMRLDLLAVGERDRQVRGADEQHVDPVGARDGVEIVERGLRLDHRDRDGERVRVAQIFLG